VRRLIAEAVHIFILPPSLASCASGSKARPGRRGVILHRLDARAKKCATAASSIMLL
jgi:hypothetical protein